MSRAIPPSPFGSVETPTIEQLREARKAFRKDYRPDDWIKLTINGERYMARKHVLHPSSEVYLYRLWMDHQDEYKATYYLLTKKCEWKRNGNAAPTDEQIQYWRAAYEGQFTNPKQP